MYVSFRPMIAQGLGLLSGGRGVEGGDRHITVPGRGGSGSMLAAADGSGCNKYSNSGPQLESVTEVKLESGIIGRESW